MDIEDVKLLLLDITKLDPENFRLRDGLFHQKRGSTWVPVDYDDRVQGSTGFYALFWALNTTMVERRLSLIKKTRYTEADHREWHILCNVPSLPTVEQLLKSFIEWRTFQLEANTSVAQTQYRFDRDPIF